MSFFLKWFFRLLYNQFAWVYDLVSSIVSLGAWQDWMAAALPYLQGDRVLELGHGPGHLQVALASLGKEAVGLDQSHQMNRIAYRRLNNNHFKPGIINGYAQTLPLQEAVFDHVLASFPTEYILQPQTLAEIRRVLTSTGTLVVVPAAILTGSGPVSLAIRLLYKVTGQAPESFSHEVVDSLAQPFKDAGFDTTVHITILKNSQVLVLTALSTHQTV